MSRVAAFALAVALAGPALARPALAAGHAIDMTIVLSDEAGRPARDVLARAPSDPAQNDPDCAQCPVLTLGHAAAHALFATLPGEKDVTPDQKWARAVLATRLKDDKAAHLDAEETAVVKRLLGEAYGGVVLMQAYPLLDPNAQSPGVK